MRPTLFDKEIRAFLILILVTVFLTACTTYRLAKPPTIESACLQQFEALDTKLENAGLHDAGAYRIPGFPFLRLTRFMASFTGELDSLEKRRTWVQALRIEDQQARESELRNLGVNTAGTDLDTLAGCGDALVANTLNRPEKFDQLLVRARVPDDYSVIARVFGLYPFAVPFLKQGIAGYHDKVRSNFAGSLHPAPGADLIIYTPEDKRNLSGQGGNLFENVDRDPLGRPQISEQFKKQLFRMHAPVWWVEELTSDDRPGRPVWRNGERVITSDHAVVYTKIAHTRVDDQVLLQLVYVMWFPARTPDWVLDPYAGDFDALIWRVTLDAQGQPLMYDSIHGCGCYHYFFMARPLHKNPQDGWDGQDNQNSQNSQDSYWQEPVLFPQADVPSPPLVLRLEAGTHYLRRVLPLHAVEDSKAQTYRLLPYSQLHSLPDGRGGYKSLFAENGLLPGSERLERFWLWPSGVISPGAMRQWGRHATAFVGRRHFDDPCLFEDLFTGSN